MADEIEMHQGHWRNEGWLGSKQSHWSGVEGAPPLSGKTSSEDGFYGDGKFRLAFPAAVLAGLAAFGGFVVYEESHSSEEGEHGGESSLVEEPEGVGANDTATNQ